jgi:hypothetical protein
MQKRREKAAWVASVILLLALSCSGKENAREQASDLLERISRLDPTASMDTRDAALRALSDAPVAAEDLRALRDACVSAHRGLLGAERSQAEVRTKLDQGKPEAEELPALESALASATAQLKSARTALDACEHQKREVTLRYR